MFITFSFSANYVLLCKLNMNHSLFIFWGNAFMWLGGEFFAEGAQWLDFLLSPPASFFYVNFLYIFPVPMQAFPVDVPSLLYQYFDSSEKTVYLKLERAVQHHPLLLKSV